MQADTAKTFQKLLEFLEDDREAKERFQEYVRETNPEPEHVELPLLEGKIKAHTEYQGEQAKEIAEEMADAVTHPNQKTEKAEALRDLYHQLNRKQWQHWHS